MQLALRIFMPVAGLFFALSFLWDFHGLIRSCSVAGMIGFATNWVAIKMLFWPREPRPIFGQGLIPSQRDQLIEKVADEVLENLINEELILEKIEETRIVQRLSSSAIEKMTQVMQDPEFKADLRRVILTWVAELTSNPQFRDRLEAAGGAQPGGLRRRGHAAMGGRTVEDSLARAGRPLHQPGDRGPRHARSTKGSNISTT